MDSCASMEKYLQIIVILIGTSCQTMSGSPGLSEVKCMADQITVTVFKQMVFDLVEFIDGSIVYLGHDGFNQSKCISSESGGQLVVVLRWPFEDCGTIARWNGQNVTYSNRLYLGSAKHDKAGNQANLAVLDWKCIYPRKYSISFSSEINASQNLPEEQVMFSQFGLEMQVYNSPTFNPTAKLTPPIRIFSGQSLFIQVELTTLPHDGVQITYDACRASNSKNYNYHQDNNTFFHNLIVEGCVTNRSSQAALVHSESSAKARFSFKIFSWFGKSQPVYIHCIVAARKGMKSTNLCQPSGLSMLSSERDRRSVVDHEISNVSLVVGPFWFSKRVFPNVQPFPTSTTNVKRTSGQGKSASDSNRSQHFILGSFIAVAILSVGFACIVLYAKRRRNDCFDSEHGCAGCRITCISGFRPCS